MSEPIITKMELETGFVAPDEKLLPKEDITDRAEFANYALSHGFVGVDYPTRVKFLEANKYALNRKNLTIYLPDRITPEEKPHGLRIFKRNKTK